METEANISTDGLMEDELLYSYISRLAKLNCMENYAFENLFVYHTAIANLKRLRFGTSIYIPRIASILKEDPLDFFLRSGIYPGTAPLLTVGHQARLINKAFRKDQDKYPKLIGRTMFNLNKMKYCPLCAEEDMAKHGESWLRRAHHMPGINVCWKHGVYLSSPVLSAKSITYPLQKSVNASAAEIEFAKFGKDFLDAGFGFNLLMTKKIIKNGLRTAKAEKCTSLKS